MLIGFVMDRSGSMTAWTDAAIEGFNAFLLGQRETGGGEALVSLALFNHEVDVRHVAAPIAEVPAMARTGENAYRAGGQTALLDAVAAMICGVQGWLEDHPEHTDPPTIAVFTDGAENASRIWTRETLNKLIGDKQALGWDFVFLGSGGAAWLEGQSMSNLAVGTVNTGSTRDEYAGSFEVLSRAATTYRAAGPGGQSISSSVVEHYSPAAPVAPKPVVDPADKLAGRD